MERRRGAGGIRRLLELIEEHRAPLEYDWRAVFGLPLSSIGRSVSWGEAVRLVDELAADPATHTAAALAGWAHPWSREAALLADLFDLTLAVNAKNPKPYPRPWVQQGDDRKRIGDASKFSQAEIREELARMRGATHG